MGVRRGRCRGRKHCPCVLTYCLPGSLQPSRDRLERGGSRIAAPGFTADGRRLGPVRRLRSVRRLLGPLQRSVGQERAHPVSEHEPDVCGHAADPARPDGRPDAGQAVVARGALLHHRGRRSTALCRGNAHADVRHTSSVSSGRFVLQAADRRGLPRRRRVGGHCRISHASVADRGPAVCHVSQESSGGCSRRGDPARCPRHSLERRQDGACIETPDARRRLGSQPARSSLRCPQHG